MEASLPEGIQLQTAASEQYTDTYVYAYRLECDTAKGKNKDVRSLLSYHTFPWEDHTLY